MEAEVVIHYEEKKIIVAQLEIANMEEFLRQKEDKVVEVLKKVKQEKELDYIFINCIDILNGFNIIVTIDDDTKEFLEKKLGYSFENSRCKFDKVLQRKDITKAIRETLK